MSPFIRLLDLGFGPPGERGWLILNNSLNFYFNYYFYFKLDGYVCFYFYVNSSMYYTVIAIFHLQGIPGHILPTFFCKTIIILHKMQTKYPIAPNFYLKMYFIKLYTPIKKYYARSSGSTITLGETLPQYIRTGK